MPVILVTSGVPSISLGIHPYGGIDESYLTRQNFPLNYPPNPSYVPPDGLGWTSYRNVTGYVSHLISWTMPDPTSTSGGIFFGSSKGTSVLFTVGELLPEFPLDATTMPYPWILNQDDLRYGIPDLCEYFRKPKVATLTLNKPSYKDLVSGYTLDSRTIPNSPTIISAITQKIKISYYRWNRLESITNLKSICWMVYECNLVANAPYSLPIIDCVLGTLYCSDSSIIGLIAGLPNISGSYEWACLMPTSIPSIFIGWNTLYEATNDNPTQATIFPEIRLLRKLAANNNVWGNANLGSDINPESTHPMFIVDEARSYDWHYKPVSEGIGDLIMDGPRTIESHAALVKLLRALQVDNYQVENLTSTPPLHYLDWYIKNGSGEKLDKIYNALDAEQWGTNPDDPEIPRVANLGHLISKIASLLGYRPEHDGTFDPAKEKALVRQIVNRNEPIDPTKVGVNNFGSLGMIMRRLNNSFKGKKIVADECVIVRDLPQIMAEYQDQLNLALGLQESSAIEIKGTDNTARYENQLAVMIELLNLVKSSNESIRAALISSLVAQAQSSEIIAALGLPTVTKSLPVKIDNKIDHLPYKGVSAHRSISQEIAVCTANVGIVLGQVL